VLSVSLGCSCDKTNTTENKTLNEGLEPFTEFQPI